MEDDANGVIEPEQKQHFRRIKRFFITTVIGGFVVVLPIGLLVFVLQFLYGIVTDVLSPLREVIGVSPDIQVWLLNAVSIVIIVVAFFLIGLLVRTGIGRKAHSLIDSKVLSRVPFYSTLRATVQQFFGRQKMPFSKVVIADVMDVKMTGFITDEREDHTYTIFVPTAPNPTNGFVFHVNEDQLQFLDVRPEEAMRTVFGMGTGSSNLFDKSDVPEKPRARRLRKRNKD